MSKRKNIVGIVMVAVIIVLALTLGLSVYSAPGNQLSRQLDFGYKYLKEGCYTDAVVAFENAISIDEKCMEAYVGGIEAYLLLDDQDALLVFYDRALAVAENPGEEISEQNKGFIEEIYLAADRVYGDAPERKVEILKKGWTVTQSPTIKGKLIEGYLDVAEGKVAKGDYEGGLETLDKLSELTADAESVREVLEKCLDGYLECLLEEKNYDEVRKLSEKYGQLTPGIDFGAILKQIEEQEALEAESVPREGEKEVESESEQESGSGEGSESEKVSEIEEGTEVVEEDTVAEVQGDSVWVDDLYQKIIAEDVDGVFSIMEQPDFIEKCDEFPHSVVTWSVDYCLSTSGGKSIWVVKGMDSEFLSVAYQPDGSNYGAPTDGKRILGAPAVGWGDYVFEINYDGGKDWLIKTVGYRSDIGRCEPPEGTIWEVYHM